MNFYKQVLIIDPKLHEKEFQKEYVQSVIKLIRIKAIEIMLTLIFSNNFIFKEIFAKQLDTMNKTLIQIYNEAI